VLLTVYWRRELSAVRASAGHHKAIGIFYGLMMTTQLVETCCQLISNKLRISCGRQHLLNLYFQYPQRHAHCKDPSVCFVCFVTSNSNEFFKLQCITWEYIAFDINVLTSFFLPLFGCQRFVDSLISWQTFVLVNCQQVYAAHCGPQASAEGIVPSLSGYSSSASMLFKTPNLACEVRISTSLFRRIYRLNRKLASLSITVTEWQQMHLQRTHLRDGKNKCT
jgi:hypothetical protein